MGFVELEYVKPARESVMGSVWPGKVCCWDGRTEGNTAKSVPKESDVVCLNGNPRCATGSGRVTAGDRRRLFMRFVLREGCHGSHNMVLI